MGFPNEGYQKIRVQVESDEDAHLICNLVTHVCNADSKTTQELGLKIINTHPDKYIVEVGPLSIISHKTAQKLYSESLRVTDVLVHFEKKRILIEVARENVTLSCIKYVRGSAHRKRAFEIDYAAGGVTDKDDQTLMDAIHEEVVHCKEALPRMNFYYDTITNLNGAMHNGYVIPQTARTPIDAAESSEEHTIEEQRVGYSLSFYPMPTVLSCSFFKYLTEKYTRVTTVFAWLDPKDQPSARLVINIRRAHIPQQHVVREVMSHLPRPITTRKKARNS